MNLIADPQTALKGVLWRGRGAWLVLREVTALKTNGDPVPLDGEVLVHRSNVAFVQALP